jgi:hypothetical protein
VTANEQNVSLVQYSPRVRMPSARRQAYQSVEKTFGSMGSSSTLVKTGVSGSPWSGMMLLNNLVVSLVNCTVRRAAGRRQRPVPEPRLDEVHRLPLQRHFRRGVVEPVGMDAYLDTSPARESRHQRAHASIRN